ncbi:hypothetical protein J2X31_000203 [Flavobacterium arsenatis]|uniref:Uncharacterized protein n=1 Tax=Flavobacterium arsenatis TaxID=1484332 RepID=A0ABU1TJQ5_9FLAO|nr:hypothetical protein [Flavobacterium arsenatis]MDR6966210.1 hypothetical protein [Flavobacterium arsenatis]
MSNIIFHSKEFEINGISVPEFNLQGGKLIRIYIQNFNLENLPLGFDMTIELIRHFQNQKPNFHWAKNYHQNNIVEFFYPLTVHKYLISKMRIHKLTAERIAKDIGVELTDRFEDLSFVKRKALIIKSMFEKNDFIMLDYYGVHLEGIGYLENLVNSEIERGKTAIAFDRLEFKADKEPYDNIESILLFFK